ncbi:restriction endonuclease subunit S [Acinetobacter pseudolwoffii]|uniref:restriction endonuclease subunit S n=1 Tax=Acinetobacter pseudolwoffii TaxID=2053287 RepID=UPI003B839028
MGQAPSGDSYNFDSEGLALIAGAGDFGKQTPEPKKFTTAAGKKSEKGEIILCIRATIGDLNWSDKEYCLGRGVAGLFGHKDKLDQKYLWYWLTNVAPILKSKGKGATFLQVTKEDICSLEITLPPLSEQRRIASILDKAHDLRQKRQQAIEKLDQLLQATFIDMFGDPVSNPKGWDLFKLSDICSKITVGIVVKPASYYVESGIPAIRSLNIGINKIIKKKFVYFSEENNNSTLKKTKLLAGDVVTVRSGQPGKSAVIEKDMEGCNAIDVLITRTDNTKLLPEFLSFFLNSDAGKKLVMKEQRGQVQKHLNVSQLAEAVIPLPPIELQKKFLRNLGEIYSIINSSADALHLINNLFISLQKQAFSGNL